jgi:polysaccharide pyruvyl transferase WcaK-like protein
MIVSLWGYYGFNYGDDIMMKVLIEELTKKNVKVILVDSHNGKLKDMMTESENLEIIDFFNLTKGQKIRILYRLARTAHLNFWGGGTVFTDVDGDGNFKSFLLLKLFGGKIGYISVGIGDMKKISRKLKTNILIKVSDIITFRDKVSYSLSKNINSKNSFYCEDITYYYFNSFKSKINCIDNKVKNQSYLLVSIRNLVKYFGVEKEAEFSEQITKLIPKLMERYNLNRVIFLPLDIKDIEINEKIRQSLDKSINAICLTNQNIDYMTEIIKNADIYISGRLHGSVAGEFFGVNTISLSYSNKINYFYDSIQFPYFIDLRNDNITLENVENIINKRREKHESLFWEKYSKNSYNNIIYLLDSLKG